MNVGIQKVSDISTVRDDREDAVSCSLYQACVHHENDAEAEKNLKSVLTQENPLIGLVHVLTCISDSTTYYRNNYG